MNLRSMLVACGFLSILSFPCRAQIGQVPFARSAIISGDCTAELKPSIAVISGGVTASALKPTDAADQLDKQLALIRSYVQEKKGALKELERVRSFHAEGSINGQPRDPTFQVGQRLRIEFPAAAPVDQILDHLMELGFNRFGDNMAFPDYRTSIVVVHFEVPNFEAEVKKIREECIAVAWKQWCAAVAPKDFACDPSAPPASLQVQNFTLRSTEKLMRPEGPPDYFRTAYASYPSQAPITPPELLGNVPIHLVGNVVMNNPELDRK